jgi:hypothetical protein
MGDSVSFGKSRNNDFLIIPFRDFDKYKIATILNKWKYIVISDTVAGEKERRQCDGNNTQAIVYKLKKMLTNDTIPMRGSGFFFTDIGTDVEFDMWTLGPNDSEQQDIVIGPRKSHVDAPTNIGDKEIKGMFTKSTKHYMTIEVTCTDTDPLTTEDIDPTGMYTAFAKYWS